MNNEALILVDVPCEDAEKVLAFIQTKTKGLKGEEHEILDTFPILYIRDTENGICEKMEKTSPVSRTERFLNFSILRMYMSAAMPA